MRPSLDFREMFHCLIFLQLFGFQDVHVAKVVESSLRFLFLNTDCKKQWVHLIYECGLHMSVYGTFLIGKHFNLRITFTDCHVKNIMVINKNFNNLNYSGQQILIS